MAGRTEAGAHREAQQGVESVETGGLLLQALAAGSEAMMLRDLAAAAGMAPAKAHRYLVSLMRLGLVAREAESGRYDIGPFAIRLGLAGLNRQDPLRIASSELGSLRDALGHTVALAVWGSHGPTVVRWMGSRTPVSAGLHNGSVLPLTRSAAGRAFLAFHELAPGSAVLDQELRANRRDGLQPADAAGVRSLIEETCGRGFGRVDGDLVAEIRSVAMPIRDAQGDTVLVVLALGYRQSFDDRPRGALVPELKRWVREVQIRLGGSEPPA